MPEEGDIEEDAAEVLEEEQEDVWEAIGPAPTELG